MVEFKHILCPIDFSDASLRALTYAAALAKWYEAELQVVHVAPAVDEGLVIGPDGGLVEPRRRQSSDAAGSPRFAARWRPSGPPVWPEVLTADGRTHDVIVERAQGAREPTCS